MQDVYIVSAARTAIGSFGGSLGGTPVAELGSIVMREALKRAGVEAGAVDEAIMGSVLNAGQGQNVTRQAALKAGIGADKCAWTVSMVCGSGMKAVHEAAASILLGSSDVVVAGGMENMSQAPYTLPGARWGQRMGNGVLEDTLIKDGLQCAMNDYHMGITAENVADQWGITREQQDEFAAASQQKAVAAIESGAFRDEIVPVEVKVKKQTVPFDTDEYPRAGTTAEKLAGLRAAFKGDGTVTAGNASGINDGAAAVVLASGEAVKKLGLKPMAKLVACAQAGVDPAIMGTAPIQATQKVLEKAGWSVSDLDIVEANEAFASQSIAVVRDLGLDADKVNVNGGAIALGHPIGASGARILVTLLYAMKHRGLKKGLATLCIGGGMGVATLVEAVD